MCSFIFSVTVLMFIFELVELQNAEIQRQDPTGLLARRDSSGNATNTGCVRYAPVRRSVCAIRMYTDNWVGLTVFCCVRCRTSCVLTCRLLNTTNTYGCFPYRNYCVCD